MYVYLIICEITGKYYVGQHSGPNLQSYLKSKISAANRHKYPNHLYSAMRKYGRDVFTIYPIAKVSSKEEMDKLEILWINILDSRNPKVGMNIGAGGEKGNLGMKLSDVSRKKFSEVRRGIAPKAAFFSRSKEQNLRMSKIKKTFLSEHPYTEETRNRMSKARKKFLIENPNSTTGKMYTEEERKNISLGLVKYYKEHPRKKKSE